MTLRGLVVENVWDRPRLFPWTQVGRIPGADESPDLYDDDGRPALTPGGRPPRGLALPTMQERVAARRAQHRALRRAWADGPLRLAWVNPLPPWQPVAGAAFGVGMLALLSCFTAKAVQFAIGWWPLLLHMPGGTAVWTIGSLVLLGLLMLPLRSLLLSGVRDGCFLAYGNVTSALFTARGLSATMRSGRTIEAPWDDVFDLSGNGLLARITLLSGEVLRLPSDRRLIRVISLAVAANPRIEAGLRRRVRRERLALAAYTVFVLAAGCIIYAGPLGIGGHPLQRVGFLLLMAAAFPATMGLLVAWMLWQAKATIRRERAARRPPGPESPR